MLIEQKTVFASRAAARIRYILMEGAVEEDQTIAFVNLLTQSEKRDEILDKLSQKMKLTEPYRVMNEKIVKICIRDVTGKKKHLYRRR